MFLCTKHPPHTCACNQRSIAFSTALLKNLALCLSHQEVFKSQTQFAQPGTSPSRHFSHRIPLHRQSIPLHSLHHEWRQVLPFLGSEQLKAEQHFWDGQTSLTSISLTWMTAVSRSWGFLNTWIYSIFLLCLYRSAWKLPFIYTKKHSLLFKLPTSSSDSVFTLLNV